MPTKIVFAEGPKQEEKGPGNVSPEMVVDRHENVVGKKMCGLCGHRSMMKGSWFCSKNLPCPVPERYQACINWTAKSRKIKPSQANPARIAIPAGVHFLYFGRPRRGERHQGVMTIAWRINEERHEVEIGFAFCSPLDSWSKEKGRSIAMTRLATMVIRAPYFYNPRYIVEEIVQALLTHDFQTAAQVCRAFPSSQVRRHVPGWSQDLAKRLWVKQIEQSEKEWKRTNFRQDRAIKHIIEDVIAICQDKTLSNLIDKFNINVRQP